jgi:hypothetical protein
MVTARPPYAEPVIGVELLMRTLYHTRGNVSESEDATAYPSGKRTYTGRSPPVPSPTVHSIEEFEV